MLTAVASGFALALVAPVLSRALRARAAWLLAFVPAAVFAWLIGLAPSVAAGATRREAWPWIAPLGTQAAFLLDGLSLLFGLLVSGIGALVFAYSGAYLGGDARAPRFYAILSVFMASMLGLVLADDLLLLFVFWELTSVTSYLLVGYDHERPGARAAALQALLVTAGGGLALLAGFLLLGHIGGTYAISELLARGDAVRSHPWYLPTLGLVLLGAFTKSAQVPFHFWLPAAMAAPSPVSAYLHSATMVKAGVYLLARLSVVLGMTDAWHDTVALVGAVTMVTGAAMALPQRDLKLILAYTTVSALGAITLLIGLETTEAATAAAVFLLVHALYKGALFLAAGAVDHEAGSRDVGELGGLIRAMPVTAAAILLACLSMAGLPPLFGFVAKELLYEAKTQAPHASSVVTTAGLVANVLVFAAAARLAVGPLFGAGGRTPRAPHEGPLGLWLGPVVLAGLGLVLGVLPDAIAGPLVAAAVTAVRAEPTVVTLALWHGFNPILLLSLATIGLGTLTWLAGPRLAGALAPLGRLGRAGPARAYEATFAGFLLLAKVQTRWLQSGQLSRYVRVTILTLVAVAVAAAAGRVPPRWAPGLQVQPLAAVLLGLIAAGAVAVVTARARLVAVAALGVVGFGVALSFLVWSGPDLALTQFAIETLSVLLFVFVVYRLPRFVAPSPRLARIRDLAVAGAAGLLVAGLLWAVTASPRTPHLADYFAAASVPEGRGRNVVNVILVDFRAFDTLGEITVLVVAALGVYGLMRLRLGEER
jgi:multicomponent Na+:H+ antiporter subunit A